MKWREKAPKDTTRETKSIFDNGSSRNRGGGGGTVTGPANETRKKIGKRKLWAERHAMKNKKKKEKK